MAYKERHWHEQCFVCSECKASLVGVAFGSRDDRIYCSSCFDTAFGVKCKACEKILKPGDRKLDYRNEQFHADCFRCAKCESPIGTKSFLTKNGSVYCSPCYQTKFATRCIKCCEVFSALNAEHSCPARNFSPEMDKPSVVDVMRSVLLIVAQPVNNPSWLQLVSYFSTFSSIIFHFLSLYSCPFCTF